MRKNTALTDQEVSQGKHQIGCPQWRGYAHQALERGEFTHRDRPAKRSIPSHIDLREVWKMQSECDAKLEECREELKRLDIADWPAAAVSLLWKLMYRLSTEEPATMTRLRFCGRVGGLLRRRLFLQS